MKVIFISPYPTEGPSYRYRVEQYFPYLEKNGIKCVPRPFLSSAFYKILYKPKNIFRKCFYFSIASISRFFDFFRAFRYDIIFIHLEAYPIGPPVFEYLWAKFGKTIVYDLDDAIFLPRKKISYKIIKFLKYYKKIPTLIRLSREITVCNDYLKDYTSQFKSEEKIHVIPTSVDTKKFIPRHSYEANKQVPVIGWIGSHTTADYLDLLRSVFQTLSKKYNFVLKIVGAGQQFEIPGVKTNNHEWSLSRDLEDFHSLDIGVYPLPDDEWIKGKAGFKAILYMSMGIPCVCSPVGVNKEIIIDGVNSFLASTEEEWIEKLTLLITDPDLRKKLGLEGRKTIEERFSLRVSAPKLLEVLKTAHSAY